MVSDIGFITWSRNMLDETQAQDERLIHYITQAHRSDLSIACQPSLLLYCVSCCIEKRYVTKWLSSCEK